MYTALRSHPAATGDGAVAAPASRTVWRTVVALGVTSMLTDLSAEMVTAVLPVYLVVTLGYTPLAYGLVNGLYLGGGAVVRLASGVISDRWHRHKSVAVTGYALGAVTKVGLLASGGSPAVITGSLAADRVGKGIRTAPRDAMLSLSAAASQLGLVFGVHRAMDTLGAMLGPVVAFVLLSALPGDYDLVFVVSLGVAVIGVAALVTFIDEREVSAAVPALTAAPRPSLRSAFALLRLRPYRTVVIVATLFALATVGDGFVYLRLSERSDLAVRWFPLLAAGTAAVYLVFAVPLGRLADRLGRLRVLLAGYAMLWGTYAALLLPKGALGFIVCLGMLGLFYAATDGVLSAAVSDLLPPESRTSGLALLQTAMSLALLLASGLFGAMWTWRGVDAALVLVLAGLAVAMAVGVVLLRRDRLV